MTRLRSPSMLVACVPTGAPGRAGLRAMPSRQGPALPTALLGLTLVALIGCGSDCSDPGTCGDATAAPDAAGADTGAADAQTADAAAADASDAGASTADVSGLDAPSDVLADTLFDTLSDTVVDTSSDASATSDTGALSDGGADSDGAGDGLAPTDADALSDTLSGGVCPGPEPPGPDTFVGDVPQPDTSSCPSKPDPAFFKGAKPPKPTLLVEIGVVSGSGTFVAYTNGDWVPMVHGAQGGFHVWAAIRVDVPGAKGAQIKVQAETQAYDVCDLTGFAPNPVIFPTQVAGVTYQQGTQFVPGLQVRFVTKSGEAKSSSSKAFCNRWFDLRVSVRDLGSGAWGQRSVRVRTYDTGS